MNSSFIKGKMVERGLTQRDVAQKMGIATSTFSLKLSGKNEFNRSEMLELSKILDVDVNVLFFAP